MIFARTLIFGLPLLVAVLAWWSADASRRSHAKREDGTVVMLPQAMPVMHPFLPASEVERQILELVHEPLLRIGPDGALQPALAELWRWEQEVTCWFADAATAKRAQERLQAEIGEANRWAEWHLLAARVADNALLLTFHEPGVAGVKQAFEVLAGLEPQPVVFWRLESPVPLRAAWERLAAAAAGPASQVRRVWFDGVNACEIVLAGASQHVLDELRKVLAAELKAEVSMRPIGGAGALVEPVLDLDIRPGHTWDDGTSVTADDVKATLEFLRERDFQVPAREALRHIQSMEPRNNGARLHLTFRRLYGPFLGALVNLPVLPATWLRTHQQAGVADFIRHAPSGAGTHRIAARDERSLVLLPRQPEKQPARFLFNFEATPLMTQTGVSTGLVDVVWPAAVADRTQLPQRCITPPRQRLVVLWNTRHEMLGRVRLREALAMATDTDALIRLLPGRLGPVDASLFPPGLWFSTGAARTPFQLDAAHDLLARDGWSADAQGGLRREGKPLQFTLLVPSGDDLHVQAAEQLIAQWDKLGAQVKIQHVDDAARLAQRLAEHRFDAVLLDQRFEVSWDQMPWWHSSQAVPGGSNFCGIQDPQGDLLMEALASEYDPAHVAGRVRDLEARLLPQHPMLTLFTTHDEIAAAMPRMQPDGEVLPNWTLRSLALPPKVPAAPVMQLKLRLPE
jgi:ABC-type transport system substrate-binding protein